jgi:hypothetical protein
MKHWADVSAEVLDRAFICRAPGSRPLPVTTSKRGKIDRESSAYGRRRLRAAGRHKGQALTTLSMVAGAGIEPVALRRGSNRRRRWRFLVHQRSSLETRIAPDVPIGRAWRRPSGDVLCAGSVRVS